MRATARTTWPRFRRWSRTCGAPGLRCEVLYLHAEDDVLLRRYAETRRRHPLAGADESLADAIAEERRLLHPLIDSADLVIDTSRMSVHELRDSIAQRVEPRAPGRLSILFESFGFKHGTPGDADFVFDARTLPNPYWEPALKPLTGRDAKVIEFLEASPRVEQHGRGPRALHREPPARVRGGQPRLPHDRDRLHRRPAPLGVPGRAARAAFPPRSTRSSSCATTRCRSDRAPARRDDRGARFAAIQEALAAGSLRGADRMVDALHPAEVAHLLESLPPAQRAVVWQLVDVDSQGDVLVELSEEVRSELVADMADSELVAAAEGLAVDDLADLLAELPEAVTRQVLRSMDQRDRERVSSLLAYPGSSGCSRPRSRKSWRSPC